MEAYKEKQIKERLKRIQEYKDKQSKKEWEQYLKLKAKFEGGNDNE